MFPKWLKNPWSWFGIYLVFTTFSTFASILTGHMMSFGGIWIGALLMMVCIGWSIFRGLRRAGASALQIGMMAHSASSRLTSHDHGAGPGLGGKLHGGE